MARRSLQSDPASAGIIARAQMAIRSNMALYPELSEGKYTEHLLGKMMSRGWLGLALGPDGIGIMTNLARIASVTGVSLEWLNTGNGSRMAKASISPDDVRSMIRDELASLRLAQIPDPQRPQPERERRLERRPTGKLAMDFARGHSLPEAPRDESAVLADLLRADIESLDSPTVVDPVQNPDG